MSSPEPPGLHDWRKIGSSYYRCANCKIELAFVFNEYCWRLDANGESKWPHKKTFSSKEHTIPMSCEAVAMDEALK